MPRKAARLAKTEYSKCRKYGVIKCFSRLEISAAKRYFQQGF